MSTKVARGWVTGDSSGIAHEDILLLLDDSFSRFCEANPEYEFGEPVIEGPDAVAYDNVPGWIWTSVATLRDEVSA